MTEPGVLDDLPILRFLPEDARALVVRQFVPVSFPFGGVIVSEGDPTDAFFVLVSGRARAIKRSENGDEIPLNILRAGDSFGETELLSGEPHPATIRTSSDVIALRLDRTAFRGLIDRNPDILTYLELQTKHRHLQGFFRGFPAFARLPPEAVVAIVLSELEPRQVDAGDVVVRQGDPAGPMYLIEHGTVRVFRDTNGTRAYLASLGAGDYFGEVSALAGVARSATVEAISPCRFLTLGPETVKRLADAVPEFRVKLDERIGQYSYKLRAQIPEGADEEILPGGAEGQVQVGDDQVDQQAADAATVEETPFEAGGRFIKQKRRVRRMRFVRQNRRDGLRGGQPGDGHALLRP